MKKNIKFNLFRLILTIAICFLISVGTFNLEFVYAEQESINPFSVSATELDSDGYFTVNINASKDCVVEAYKIIITYDADKLVVKYGNYGFKYYSSFEKKYNANGKGLYAKNHLVDSRQIVFAGAQPVEQFAKLSAQERISYITFKYKGTDESSFEDIISSIAVNVVNYSDGEKDVVKENPDAFVEALYPQTGDDLRGEKITLGDVNDSGKVDLKDAKIILTVSLGITKIDEEKTEAADVDLDKKVTLKDAKLVLKYSLGIISSFE